MDDELQSQHLSLVAQSQSVLALHNSGKAAAWASSAKALSMATLKALLPRTAWSQGPGASSDHLAVAALRPAPQSRKTKGAKPMALSERSGLGMRLTMLRCS